MSIARATSHDVKGYCVHRPGAWQDEPWEGDVVAKVGPKIFAFLGEDSVGVKCGKGLAETDEWIEESPDDVRVSPYTGRHGWNVLPIGGAIPVEALVEAIDTSYDLVVATLPKSQRP